VPSLSEGDTRTAVEQAGFKPVPWRDDTQAALDWFKAVMNAPCNRRWTYRMPFHFIGLQQTSTFTERPPNCRAYPSTVQ
jgi:hypothetical protein